MSYRPVLGTRAGTSYEDAYEPAGGDAAYYRVCGVHTCGVGSYGFESPPGGERLSDVCP